MKPRIQTQIDELTKDADTIIAAPDTIEKWREQGLPFEEVPAQTIDELFEDRKKAASEVVHNLPQLPDQKILSPAIKSLYQEIRECIFFGLNGAAITLAGNLIEFVLKHATFVKESGGYPHYDPNKWDEFENINFYEAIERAKREGLISQKIVEHLHLFRDDIRNPYSHYNIRKITRDVVAGKVKILDLETGNHEERDIPADEDPKIQAVAKPLIDKRNVLHVFHFADEVVKYVLGRLEDSLRQEDT